MADSVETQNPLPFIGHEFEFTPQPGLPPEDALALLQEGLDGLGLDKAASTNDYKPGHFLGNGAYVYAELATPGETPGRFITHSMDGKVLLEYAIPTVNDPRWAAAAILAGNLLMPRLVAAGSHSVRPALYRRNGYAHDEHNLSVGSHTSHFYKGNPELDTDVLHPLDSRFGRLYSSFLSTLHLITGAGMVGDTYNISQHAPHTKGIVGMRDNRVTKPMYAIHHFPRNYADRRNDYRIETRNQDSSQSPIAIFLGTSLESAFLRCLWYGDRSRNEHLPAFKEPLTVMRESNTIPSIHQTHPLRKPLGSIDSLSIVEALQQYLDYIANEGPVIGLTDSEMEAMQLAQTIVAKLHNVRDDESAELVAKELDWAARLTKMRSEIGGVITRQNVEAVAFDLRWDRSLPQGFGQKYWEEIDTEHAVPRWMIDHCLTTPPPGTRTEQVVNTFLRLQARGINPRVGWNQIVYEDSKGVQHHLSFADPTGQTPPTHTSFKNPA